MVADLVNIFIKSNNRQIFSFLLEKIHQEKNFTFETAKYYAEEMINKTK